MKKEFSQMAFDFPMQAEPPAPPKNGMSSHHGETGSIAGLSAEEEHTVREEGRRAGVVVRIKSLKRDVPPPPPPMLQPEPEPVPIASPTQTKPPEKIFIQTSIPLEDIDLPIVKAEVPVETAEVETAEPDMDPVIEIAEPEPVREIPDLVAEADPAPQEVPEPPAVRPIPRAKPATSAKVKAAPQEKVKSKRGRKSLKEVAAEADLIEIPEDEVLFSKQYYTMGEVAEMFRVNQSLLRFWETEFSILQPRKNRKGDRYFRPVDIKNLHLIYHLLRQRKYTIEGAKEFLRKNKKAEQRFEAIQRLQQIKAFLLELKAQL